MRRDSASVSRRFLSWKYLSLHVLTSFSSSSIRKISLSPTLWILAGLGELPSSPPSFSTAFLFLPDFFGSELSGGLSPSLSVTAFLFLPPCLGGNLSAMGELSTGELSMMKVSSLLLTAVMVVSVCPAARAEHESSKGFSQETALVFSWEFFAPCRSPSAAFCLPCR